MVSNSSRPLGIIMCIYARAKEDKVKDALYLTRYLPARLQRSYMICDAAHA